MELKLASLAADLEQRLLPLYLLSGDEPLLVGEAADAVRARARALGFSERETHFIERVADWDAVIGAVNNLSLFAARRIVEVRMASAKPGVAGAAALTKLAQLRDPDLLLLIIAPRVDRSASWVKDIEKSGALLPVWPVDSGNLVAWLKGRSRGLGLRLEETALEMLAQRTEGNLLAAQQELQKLCLLYPAAAVDAAAVLASVADSARFDVAQLGDAALAGDSARALQVLAGLRAEGVESTLVLWIISKAVRDLWQAQRAAAGATATSRPWQRQAAALAQGLRRAGSVNFTRLILRAERADRMIKGRIEGDAWDEMALLTAEFCTRSLLPLPRTVFK